MKIGIIAPANSIIGEDNIKLFNKGVKLLENNGFEVIIGKNVFSNTEGICGSINEKLNDIYDVSSRAKYIICATGGTNSNCLLDKIDYKRIRDNVFIGNSNPTLLFNAFYKMNNICSFIGPNVKSLAKSKDLFSVNCLRERIINDNKRILAEKKYIIINKGNASGIAIGGNIQSIRRILGTKYMPKGNNHILYLEASAKETSYIEYESIISQLKQSGIFKGVKGIILGYYDGNVDFYKRIFKGFKIPIIICMNLGHNVNNNLLPIGKKISIKDDQIEEIC